MMKIKYDINLMKFISLFETLSGAKVKDCISGEPLIFVVEQGEIAKAIGKNASTLHRIENVLKKKVKIVEFNDDVTLFVKNLISPLKVSDIKEENKIITIRDSDTKTKGILIGRDSKNLNKYKDIVSRYFDIADILVR